MQIAKWEIRRWCEMWRRRIVRVSSAFITTHLNDKTQQMWYESNSGLSAYFWAKIKLDKEN